MRQPPLKGLGLRIGMDPSIFFNTRRVRDAVDRAKRRVLIRQGSYLRTVARHLIHRRRGASAPGNPPHSHVGLLREQLFYGYDRPAESVVVGPRVFKPNLDMPGVHEFGGTLPSRRGHRAARYPARPYMGPALERAEPKLASFWHDSVKA